VEAMVQVGMAKQAQYNQGVQKIQSYVDNVAGMSVSRPIEKEYLQSQLDQLGSRLKTVAAGDFSNQQLVNSVGGMAGQIVKDPVIQAAVYSYSNDKSQLAEMEADKKKGKLTPHAEYVYSRQRNEFLNNPNLKQEDGKPVMFSGKYVPSWDLEKNMGEAIKLVGDAKYSVDNIFVTDPVTKEIKYDIQKIIDPKTKKERTINNGPIYSEYAVREIHDGRFPEAVKAAINSVLNRPEAQTELGMRGVYEYRGFDSIDDFVEMYEKQKNDGLKLYTQNKLDLQTKLLNEKDPEAKKVIEKMIAEVDNNTSALELTTADQEAAARGYKSLDAYKAALYSQTTRNNYMRMFNNATVSRQYLDNPGFKAHQDIIKEQFNQWKEKEALGISRGQLKVAQRNAKVAERKQDLEERKEDNNVMPTPPLEKTATPGSIFSKIIGDATSLNDEFDGTKALLVKKYIGLTNPKMSAAEVNATFNKMAAGDPGYIDKQYSLAKDDILKNKDNVNYSHILPLLYQAQNTETKVGNTASFLKNVDEQAAAKVGNKFVDFGDLQKGLTDFTLTTEEADEYDFWPFAKNRGLFQSPNKHKLNLSPQDQVNLAIAANPSFFKSDAEKALVEQAKKAIEISTGRPIDEVIAGFSNWRMTQQSGDPRGTITESPYLQKFTQIATKIHNDGFAETLNAKEEIMKDQTLANSPVAVQLYPAGSDEKTIKTVDRNIVTLLNKYKDAGIDVGQFVNYMAPSTDNKGRYSVEVDADRSGVTPKYTLNLYDGNTLVQALPTTQADVNYAAGKTVKVPAGVSDVAQRFYFNSKKLNATNSTNDITDNPYYADAYKGAYYTAAQLQVPGAEYLIGGDVFPNYGGGYTPYVYINQGGEIKAMPIMSGGTPLQFPSVDAAGQLITSIRSKAMVDEIITNVKKK
jgi:hypothetical protein